MADAPAHRFVTDVEDSRRWRNINRRPGDVILVAPDESGIATVLGIVDSRLQNASGEPGADPSPSAPWIEDLTVPLEALVDRLEARVGPRCMRTHSPADAIPFDRDCRYLAVYAPQALGVDDESTAGGGTGDRAASSSGPRAIRTKADVVRHLASWWPHRHDANVLFVHVADLERARAHEAARIATFLERSDEESPPVRRRPARARAIEPDPDALAWLEQGSLAFGARPEDVGEPDRRELDTGAWWHPMMRRSKRPANTLDAIADRRVAEARAAGLFDDLALHGRPIPDLDHRRNAGWWADRFVRRERDHVRAVELEDEIRGAMPALWRLDSAEDVRRRVTELNATSASTTVARAANRSMRSIRTRP